MVMVERLESNGSQIRQVKGYQPDASGLKEALTGAEIVLIPAGVPRKPGMTRDGKYIHKSARLQH